MPLNAYRKQLRRKKTAFVSIHDVMPSNLGKILEIMTFLRKEGVRPITLLVVTGMDWRSRDIDLLKKLQANTNIELAGHGWRHRVDGFSTFRHRLHGMLISRNEAEHMSLPANKIADLIRRNHRWFLRAGLEPPDLYVPPAWAMGRISKKGLRALPYRYYETLFGVYDAYHGRPHPMAVCGYMADTWSRSLALRATNAVNRQLIPRPLRIAIHPDDLKLLLASDLAACLKEDFHFSSYRAFFRHQHLLNCGRGPHQRPFETPAS
jgi:predicted deacetylase